jgi:hypothetical protein
MRERFEQHRISRDMGEGLPDRKPIGEAEESELGTVEPRILANEIQEGLKNTWCLVNNHHYAASSDRNRT